MTSELTQRQQSILTFLKEYSLAYGFAPSLREIAQKFQISAPSVLDHLKAIERKGFIRRQPMKSRCLEIIKPSL